MASAVPEGLRKVMQKPLVRVRLVNRRSYVASGHPHLKLIIMLPTPTTAPHTLQTVDMTAEQSVEAVEIVTMAVDKYSSTANYEVSNKSCLVLLCEFR